VHTRAFAGRAQSVPSYTPSPGRRINSSSQQRGITLPSVDRISADDWDEPGWGTARPWVAAAWVAAIAVLLSAMAYLALRPDAWDRYQKDFGCIALTNIDTSYARSRCNAPAAPDRRAVPANATNAHAAPGLESGLGGGR
jgi:hypothetical protein